MIHLRAIHFTNISLCTKARITWASPRRKGLLGQLHLQLWHLPSFPFLRFPFWILFLQISKICPQCFHQRRHCRNKISKQASHCSNEWKCFPESQEIFGTRLDDDTAGWSLDFPPIQMVRQKVILNICEPNGWSELLDDNLKQYLLYKNVIVQSRRRCEMVREICSYWLGSAKRVCWPWNDSGYPRCNAPTDEVATCGK